MYLSPNQEQELRQRIANGEVPQEIVRDWNDYNHLKDNNLPGGDPQMRLEYYLSTGNVYSPNILPLSRDGAPKINLN